jgi:hypothetical protein
VSDKKSDKRSVIGEKRAVLDKQKIVDFVKSEHYGMNVGKQENEFCLHCVNSTIEFIKEEYDVRRKVVR